MKIGVWGNYNKGNFGDDLMALMFIKKIADMGHQPSIFRASPSLANQLNCKNYTSTKRFVADSDLIVLGGGGMLINTPLLRFLLRREAFDFEKICYELYIHVTKYKKPIIPISMGGAASDIVTNPFKKKLFDSKHTIAGTVRLPSDLRLVDNKTFQYISDVVLATKYFFQVVETGDDAAKKKKRLILNLKTKTSEPLINELGKNGILDRFDVKSFHSHDISLAHYGAYEYKYPKGSFQIDSVRSGVEFLASADIIVSSKLHVGVTGLSYGIPFISYQGPSKAKEFLKSESLDGFICDEPSELVNKIVSLEQQNTKKLPVDTMVTSSLTHFEIMENAIESIVKAN